MFLILELVRGGELFDLISSNSSSKRKKESASSANEIHEVTMRKFFMELALGINFIHSSGVAHRDLKPEVSLDSCISFHHSVIPFLCSFNIGYSHIGRLEFANTHVSSFCHPERISSFTPSPFQRMETNCLTALRKRSEH